MALTGCEAVNTGLSTVNDGLVAVNQVLGAVTGTPVETKSPIFATAKMSAEQKQKLDQLLISAQKRNSGRIAQAINEASPTIEKVLAISACIPDRSKYISQYAKSNDVFMFQNSPLGRMNYHDNKNRCLNVTNITDWSMSSYKYMNFSVAYVSDISEESCREKYYMNKQDSGEWLVWMVGGCY